MSYVGANPAVLVSFGGLNTAHKSKKDRFTISNTIIKIIFQDTLKVSNYSNVPKKSKRAKLNFEI